MNKIIFCQTPFQVIVSLFIQEQYSGENDRVDVVIINSFSGYKDVAKRLTEKNVFSNVYTAEVYEIILAHGLSNNLKKLVAVLSTKKLIRKYLPDIADEYQEMYCWNYDAFTASFRSHFSYKRKNPIKLFIFDEGYISYLPIEDMIPKRGFMKLIEEKNKLLGMPDVTRENIDGYLFFDPEAISFEPKAPIYPINRKLKDDPEFVKLVDYLFQASEEVKKYDKKYIIFEEAMLANQPEVDDEKLFREIAEKVGKENVIIKLHPRTANGDRFKEIGIKTIGTSGVPWEAIVLCGDFSDKILITIGSGSITTYHMLFGDDITAYMLFKFVKPNMPQFNSKYNVYWKGIEAKDGTRGIHMPTSKEKFLKGL